MLMPAQAIAMLAQCANTTTELTNAVNFSSRGTGTKQKAEHNAYQAVFTALVGRKATKEELEAITR